MSSYALKQSELLESSKANKIKHKKSLKEESKISTKSSMKSKEDLKKLEEPNRKPNSASIANNNADSKPNEDSYGIMIKKLRLHELERDITNLRTILAHIIIPKLNTVEISNVKNYSNTGFLFIYSLFMDNLIKMLIDGRKIEGISKCFDKHLDL